MAAERHERFEALHRSGCFVIPNPWDAGSARLMAAKGAKALATTSAGFAFTMGRPDMGTVSRDEALAHAAEILAATPLPVSGDFENGFADAPEDVAETVRLAGEVGLSGCSIEDTAMAEGHAPYDFDLAVDRIRAAAGAARSLGRPFVLCARADGIMNGHYDLAEAIRRVRAFEAAGADLLYVPMPTSLDDLGRIVQSLTKPVNALAAGPFAKFRKTDFAAIGIRRISVGSAIARLTHAAILEAADAALEDGDFTPLLKAAKGSTIDALLERGASLAAER
ncbi:isocitrate lyase/PEP mutase family protein [Jiella avicenniae]|uniref:Isocitrate lyase/phosphoenolpyruvate mutase family protein n=1 Tax=Jiella avicenniae TaxID=2907202 RepID=A0A9X1T5C8_9HYPH|nr:isocitrate lyase/phosphoenolpyruvate mutase family protein [Jiella avicenniae]MCE7029022.1 isocitrate lyase/phosphoenolpyruvate mutase family protein [Jiella avicenniae]